MATTLIGARLVDATGDQAESTLTIDRGRIVASAVPGEGDVRIDVRDLVVTPGFIDVHTHGGGGFSLHTADAQEIRDYANWAPTTGTTAFLAAVVGTAGQLPEAQLAAVAAAMTGDDGVAPNSTLIAGVAELLGTHLEGPYISVRRRGAHNVDWLRTPDPAETAYLLARFGSILRIVTVAPELPGAENLIRRLVAAGVTVSMGHTDATYEQACAAIRWRVTHATHCFNAMPSLHHRAPGPLGAIIEAVTVRGEVIPDGVHVHPSVVRMLIRALGPERTVVITDAVVGAGMSDAAFPVFGGNPARVVDGAARLPDGTITGSVLAMDQALRNIVRFAEIPLYEAVGMLTRNPARAAGVADRKGLLQPGYDADLLVFDRGLVLQATLCRGVLAYATAEARTRFQALQPS